MSGEIEPGATVAHQRVQLAIDIGGSFTDVVLQVGADFHSTKVLTTPGAPEEGVMQGLREILQITAMPIERISLFILGTTLATNALIERKGARTALVTTEGFRDAVEIGQENRFAQYDIFLEKPQPLVPRHLRFGVSERINVRGEVLRPLDELRLLEIAAQLRAEKIESVAVSFLHCYANPDHEQRAGQILQRELPGVCITLSSSVCPEVREYERTSTACANAYVQPVVAGYLNRLKGRIADAGLSCPVFLMTSGGAITTLEMGAEQPVRLVESGPAGGAILARQIAEQCDLGKALSFDMGGTTAKICFIDDYQAQLSRSFEFGRMYRFMKGSGLPIRIPVIEMVEIGAGGGSIAHVDGLGRLQVGPESATSNPGPACFGRGGVRPTVTDANCVMGLLDPDKFAGGRVKLDTSAARTAVAQDVGDHLEMDSMIGAYAISEVVAENMANAARVHGIELGKTVEQYTLVAFGGAAPLHAARLASKLGIDRLIIPASASVGSAIGFLWAPVAAQSLRSMYQKLDAIDTARVNALLDDMTAEAASAVRDAAPAGSAIAVSRVAYMRYIGQGHETAVTLPQEALTDDACHALRNLFEQEYLKLYGRMIPNLGIEVITWAVTVSTLTSTVGKALPLGIGRAAQPDEIREIFDPALQRLVSMPVYNRSSLGVDAKISGPALIAEPQTTTFVPGDFDVRVNSLGYLILDRVARGQLAGKGQ